MMLARSQLAAFNMTASSQLQSRLNMSQQQCTLHRVIWSGNADTHTQHDAGTLADSHYHATACLEETIVL